MNGTRLARNLSAAVVAGIAAWSSYRHMVGVALSVGEHPEVAYVLPLSVDGMLVVASIAMVDDRRNGRSVRWSARVAFAVGVAASVAANVAGAHPTIGARIVAAWPALALLLTVELLSRSGRRRRAAASPEAVQVNGAAPVAVVPRAPAAPRAPRKPTRRPVEQTRALAAQLAEQVPGISRAEVARRIGVTPRRLREVLNEVEKGTQNTRTPGRPINGTAVLEPV